MAEFLVVYTTTDDAGTAERIAAGAVEARVAACAQVEGAITSVYRWQGEVRRDREWRVVFKTTAERYAELEARIRSLHDYDVPEIVAVPVAAGGADYLAWVAEETSRKD